MYHFRTTLNADTGESLTLTDSCRVQTTFLGLTDENGNVAVVTLQGAAVLELLARQFLERAAQLRNDTPV